MKTRLVRREADGVVVVESAGVEVRAIDRLSRGGSAQPVPEPGASFDGSISYQLDPNHEPRVLPADTHRQPLLRTTSGCAAEAVGQILSIDSESSDRRVMVALVDCGGFVLPSPIDVADPALIGRRVEFTVSELEVWRA